MFWNTTLGAASAISFRKILEEKLQRLVLNATMFRLIGVSNVNLIKSKSKSSNDAHVDDIPWLISLCSRDSLVQVRIGGRHQGGGARRAPRGRGGRRENRSDLARHRHREDGHLHVRLGERALHDLLFVGHPGTQRCRCSPARRSRSLNEEISRPNYA